MTVRVLIADDQSIVRAGLTTILNSDPGIDVNGQAAAVPVQPVEALTEREEKVLLSVARGRTNAEIGMELHMSTSTAKVHLAHLMTKVAARNRVEPAMWAYETKRVR